MSTMSTFRFDHIHLFTRDPEATAAFYERMFGAEVIRSMPQGKPRIDLKLGGANIFILDVSQDAKAATGPSHPHQGLDHFGLEVKDIDTVCADLKAKGANFTPRPRNHPARHPHRLPDRTGGGLHRALGANRGGLVPRPSATAQKVHIARRGTDARNSWSLALPEFGHARGAVPARLLARRDQIEPGVVHAL